MNKHSFQRAVIHGGGVGLLFAGACGLWLWSQQRQETLNRRLIAALVKKDDRQALALVDAGADPNTLYKPLPAPSFRQLWNYLCHRSVLPHNDNPTAFMMACGWCCWGENDSIVAFVGSDAPQLVQAMLEHGANLNTKQHDGSTPLMGAASLNHSKTVSVLLDHGDNSNAQDQNGATALIAATSQGYPDVADLPLGHGTDVNARDRNDDTLDSEATSVTRQLLAHGADPNLSTNNGTTALQMAQAAGRPDLAALLRRAGARR